jgi:peptide chain release factor 3
VIIFINKLDREGGCPFALLDELEKKLDIKVQPLSWPISRGSSFKGVYSFHQNSLHLFHPNQGVVEDDMIAIPDIHEQALDEHVGKDLAAQLREDVALLSGVYGSFDTEKYRAGDLAPAFFGSALNNFGVKETLDAFVELAPPPGARHAETREVRPDEKGFSGFVFKIHANLDLRHRDRIAFLRICSGKFERNVFYKHVRLDTKLRFTNPASFLGQKKDVIEEAYPGDVIGLYDRGHFKIGDTLTDGEDLAFQGIPRFSPEVFRELINTSMKAKQLEKGIKQLTDEGVAQMFTLSNGYRKVVGTVGQLQFEVIKYRLEHEYGAECQFEPLNFYKACWITSDNAAQFAEFCDYKSDHIGRDKDNNIVFFAESEWMLHHYIETYKDISFHFTSEFNR